MSFPELLSRATAIAIIVGVASFVTSHILGSAITTHMPPEITVSILTDKQLTPYFHLDIHQRSPLKVNKIFLSPDFSSEDVPFPIQIVDCAPECYDVLVFRSIHFGPKRFKVELSYAIEGVGAKYVFRAKGESWVLHKRRIWEN
jgi:hypothetical protein